MNDIELLQINIINNVKNELYKKDIKEDMYLDYLFKNTPFNKKRISNIINNNVKK